MKMTAASVQLSSILLSNLFQQTFPLFIFHLNRVFLRREMFGFHVFDVIGESLLHLVVEVCILLDELGCEAVKQAKQVVRDQHLSVAACARADSNRWDGKSLRDQFPETSGHRFKHNAETACSFEEKRIFHESFRGDGSLALRTESAQLVDRLRRESEVPHNGNPRACDRADRIRAFASAFELDR